MTQRTHLYTVIPTFSLERLYSLLLKRSHSKGCLHEQAVTPDGKKKFVREYSEPGSVIGVPTMLMGTIDINLALYFVAHRPRLAAYQLHYGCERYRTRALLQALAHRTNENGISSHILSSTSPYFPFLARHSLYLRYRTQKGLNTFSRTL